MESLPEPAYLNLPGWRCVPVYAVPLSPRPSPPPPVAEPLPIGMPGDPRQWTRQHVFSWLDWCADNFSLPPISKEHFLLNGRGLCLLQRGDFLERAPSCGDVLHNALRAQLQGPSPRTCSPPHVSAALLHHHDNAEKAGHDVPLWSRSSDLQSVGRVFHEREPPSRVGSDVDSTTAPSSPPLPAATDTVAEPVHKTDIPHTPHMRQLVVAADGSLGNSTEKINVRLLWDFLQQLLNDAQQRYTSCIVWKERSRGVFKITDPPRLAALWGRQKNHLNMNFDKMSRALRYYYRVRILQKEPGERHCYRFLRHPNELRHCKQRALLSRDMDHLSHSHESPPDIEAALDMSIKEEGSIHGDMD